MTGGLCFSGHDVFDPEDAFVSDPEGAVTALRQAGFKVVGMPEELRSRESRLLFPYDSFWEVSIDGFDDEQSMNALWDKANAIVQPFGGIVDDWGVAGPDYMPFDCWLESRHDISN
jgi:hypothetical protein